MSYIKVTDQEPPVDVELFTFNGETEFKNKWNGNSWLYELKYPVTHFCFKPPVPPQEEVEEVRELL